MNLVHVPLVLCPIHATCSSQVKSLQDGIQDTLIACQKLANVAWSFTKVDYKAMTIVYAHLKLGFFCR
jgi:hypothetical protein